LVQELYSMWRGLPRDKDNSIHACKMVAETKTKTKTKTKAGQCKQQEVTRKVSVRARCIIDKTGVCPSKVYYEA